MLLCHPSRSAGASSRRPRAVALAFAGLFVALVVAAVPMAPAAAQEQESEATRVAVDGTWRINLAARQRMLSQLMAKAACFIQLDASAKHHRNALGSAQWLFDSTLSGLLEGSEIAGVEAESSEPVKERLAAVAAQWSTMSPALAAAARPGAGGEVLARVFETSQGVLETMERAIREMEIRYAESGRVEESLAVAINLAGRQGMLIQRAAKEFCWIAVDKAAGEDVRKSLAGTVELFNATHLDLLNGNADLGTPPPPIGTIGDQLRAIGAQWQPLADVFLRVADGETPSQNDIDRVAGSNEYVLEEMNKAVYLYEVIR